RDTGDVVVRGLADRLAVYDRRRLEPAGEPAPGDGLGVEQVADVAAGHLQGGRVDRAGGVAVVVRGRQVGDQRAVGDRAGGCRGDQAVGLPCDQVQRLGHGRAERGGEVVVAHREALRVVPQRGDGVAVVVVHGQRRVAAGAGRAHRLYEPVEQPGV